MSDLIVSVLIIAYLFTFQLAFQTSFANIDIYKSCFFSQTIRDWNSPTDSLISAAEGAEDSVAKFISLVRLS